MREYDGVWLAAPQIGKNIRMVATTQWKESKKEGSPDKFLWEKIMINPEIIEKSKDTICTEEGCLSLPGITGDVRRYKQITLKYSDLKGKKHKKVFKNFDAIVIQHEIDHLDGILFIDKIEE